MEQKQEALVFYPSPGTNNLNPIIEFANLIVETHHSLSITILLTCLPDMPESAFDALIASASPSLAFLRLPSNSPSKNCSGVEVFFEIPRLSRPDIRSVMERISGESRVKAFVIDMFCNAAFEVSELLGIDTYFFCTYGGCGLAGFLYLPEARRVSGESRDPRTVIRVPGLPGFPFSAYPGQCREGEVSKLFESAAINMSGSRGILVNTFRELEGTTVRVISEGLCVPNGPTPPVYCIGPLIGENIKREPDPCPRGRGKELAWLDLQPQKSVVFLCFGRMGGFSGRQLKEIAIGLEKCGHRFLWVVRDPPQWDDREDLFLPGFLDKTRGRGLVVENWAPQKAVLSHDSVGGFVTHCGWNSILEAVCAGVPMITWPLYAEQKINREAIVEEMRVALRLNESEEEEGFVSAVELEKRVTELMDSDSSCGRQIRERVAAMKEVAVATMAEGGSSRLELARFIGSLK